LISLISPAFNESANLGPLYERLAAAMAAVGVDWEWIVVDDHSRDNTFDVLRALTARDPRVRGVRLARNSGSHVAITCGLHLAKGDAAIMLAADLQDPPETIRAMLERWRAGAEVVWATRRERPGDRTHSGFAAVYYWIMRRVVGMKEMPERGADFFLIGKPVLDAFRQFRERNVSVLALITWIGFRQETIEYDKQPRTAGRSGWTLARKVKLVVDSIVSFTDLPIRLCWYGGAALLALAVVVGVIGIAQLPTLGAALLLMLSVVLGLAGLQLIALGLIGEYVWRTLDEARGRPQYLIEAVADAAQGERIAAAADA
jgi:glycosyltransferase involved in cell wall biosynthesis